MRRLMILWTLLATVLIGTGAVERLHRAGHDSHRQRSHASQSHRVADHGLPLHDSTPDAPVSADDLGEHNDHQCPVCVTLASLAGSVSLALQPDRTPIERLVGTAILADSLAPALQPLEAVGARPPPIA